MVRRTSPENQSARYGAALEPSGNRFALGNLAAPAFVNPHCSAVERQQHTFRANNEADSLSWRVVHVAALAGLVALWLCS